MGSIVLASKRRLWVAWIAFLAAFPAGMLVGCLLGRGHDAAGSGIGIGTGMLGVGLLGGIASAIYVSYFTVRALPNLAGRLLACLPWFILVIIWWIALFTPTGDRLAEWLEIL